MAGRSGPRNGGRGASTQFRRLAVRTRAGLDAAFKRLRASALPVMQCGVAAGLAWLVAFDVFGHERPFFAPIAAVISLGVSLANRLQRAVELVVGVSLGVLVGDLLISVIGSGWWQLTLVVTSPWPRRCSPTAGRCSSTRPVPRRCWSRPCCRPARRVGSTARWTR